MKSFIVYFFVLVLLNGSTNCLRHYSVDEKSNTITYKTDGDVNMILLGDWGGVELPPYTSPFEFVTAKQIMKRAKIDDTDFVLALGDNFYFHGVTDEYDSRFQSTFEDIFDEDSFKSVPWFVLAGNHDHYGNITGQIEYSKHSKRWNFPSLWYKIRVLTPAYNATIIMIDTVNLCGNTRHDVHGDQPNPDTRNDAAFDDQLNYIKEQLMNNEDSYLFVAGHFPVWSIAEHGPTDCLLKHLKPLLEKYGASAYFCGHDHNLQHIKEDSSKVEYFLSGAGDMVNPSLKNLNSIPKGSLKFHTANLLTLGGFANLHLGEEVSTIVYESGMGSILYKYEFARRK